MRDSALQFISSRGRMALPELNIPSQDIGRRPRPYMRPRQLQQWTAELPIGNTTVAAHQMLEQLKTLNRSRYPVKERLQLQNTLRPVLSELLHAMRQPLRQVAIPLDYKHQYNANLIQQLLEQMAVGYKLIVSELALSSKMKEFENLLLQEATYLAIIYLGQRLVEAYSLYQPEPEKVWSDLNQLYQSAEARQFHQNTIDDSFPDTPLPVYPSIDFAYKRVLLLALAEPYHLMQYEAEDLFRLITSSVQGCNIDNYLPVIAGGEYVIDFNVDDGPRFLSPDQEWQASDPHIIDITDVKSQLDTHLQRLLRTNAHHATLEAVSLVERQQRDMLLRLADAWNASLVRQTRRFSLKGKIELSSGLNASHYFISNGALFTPEMDELKLTADIDEQSYDLHTVFATAYHEALQKDRKHSFQQYQLNPWWQRNVSPIGVALNCLGHEHNLDMRVGELVIYRFADKKYNRWQIGVVRWLQHDNNLDSQGNINIGVMNIANGAIVTGAKAIKGLGSGTDYFRSLLVPKQVSLEQTRSIIVPAFLYDVGTTLAVNMRQRIFHIHLTRMMISTRSFTQFDFEVIERPMGHLL